MIEVAPKAKELNTSDLLINTLFLGLTVPTILSSLFDVALKLKTNNGFIWVNVNNSNYKKISLILILFTLVACVLINLLAISRKSEAKFPLVRSISFLFLLYVGINYLYMPENWYIYQVLAVCVFWVYGIVSPFEPLSILGLKTLKSLVTISVTISFVFALLLPERATFVCRSDKCGVFGNLWMGFFPHENALGFFSVVCFGIAFIFANKINRYAIRASSFLLILASGSRIALICFTCLLFFQFFNKTVITLIPVLVFSVSLILFLNARDYSLLTGRGGIWMRIRSNLADQSWIFGQGMSGFQTGQSKSVFGFTLVDEQSTVVSILSRYGAVGFIFFLVFFMTFYFYRSTLDKRMLTLLSVFSVAMVSESFGVPTFLNYYTFIYFMTLMQTTTTQGDVEKSIPESASFN